MLPFGWPQSVHCCRAASPAEVAKHGNSDFKPVFSSILCYTECITLSFIFIIYDCLPLFFPGSSFCIFHRYYILSRVLSHSRQPAGPDITILCTYYNFNYVDRSWMLRYPLFCLMHRYHLQHVKPIIISTGYIVIYHLCNHGHAACKSWL